VLVLFTKLELLLGLIRIWRIGGLCVLVEVPVVLVLSSYSVTDEYGFGTFDPTISKVSQIEHIRHLEHHFVFEYTRSLS